MNYIKSIIVKVWGQKLSKQEQLCGGISIVLYSMLFPFGMRIVANILNIDLHYELQSIIELIGFMVIFVLYTIVTFSIIYYPLMALTTFINFLLKK